MNRNERIGTAQRLAALEGLSKALEDGYLDLAEYEQRMMAVQSARTVNDLIAQVVDLPAQFQWNPHQMVTRQMTPPLGSGQSPKNAPLALGLGIASVPVSMCLGFGLVLGCIAIFLGRRGIKDGENYSYSLVGIVLGIAGVVLSLLFIGVAIFAPGASAA
ncbi:DUF1707 domain-containing protein [Micromonospora aurantiaca]|uniref:DUF1707 SHOCT-like domain-containing protein n=1 Tax=Micromonospora aurantiaca (nom. illeg.) TaxID=47850 RepID=UPI0033BF484F